jgi:hypothetical protein
MLEIITSSLRLVYYLRNPKLMRTLEKELWVKLVKETTTPDWNLEGERMRLLVRWVAMATAASKPFFV